jgi:uncharacterized repeat protein (TIGR01451 family)
MVNGGEQRDERGDMSCGRRFGSFPGRWLCTVAVIVSAFLLSASPASAHQNPANCTGNNLELRLLKNKTQIVSGETVHYTVNVRNDALGACDIDNATVTFTCPAPNGTPTGAAGCARPAPRTSRGSPQRRPARWTAS